jgi:uncharacterized repeat protein (TIGR02543 family)
MKNKTTLSLFTLLFAASAFAETVDLSTLTGNYVAQDGDVLTGKLVGYYTISIDEDAIVTIDGVTINGEWGGNECAGITCKGNCTINLKGENNIKGGWNPGIYVPENKTLTISGKGKLNASSISEAGICGGNEINCGNIIIDGGTITATGGYQAAGIGSGDNGVAGNITINGGTVIATGGDGYGAPGIGSGYNGVAGNITINGGTVIATGGDGYGAPGIGSGDNGVAGNITINGGTVTATGEGSGIGSGYNGVAGNISINGGIVTSSSGYREGIGGKVASITITGGAITATSGDNGYAGIGGEEIENITISGGIVTATGGVFAAGIGSNSGDKDKVSHITISGGYIDAKGGVGIGGTYFSDITISGGYIIATGGSGIVGSATHYGFGAGIGGNEIDDVGNITISGGFVMAKGGVESTAIGTAGAFSGNITISNNDVIKVTATIAEEDGCFLGYICYCIGGAETVTIGGVSYTGSYMNGVDAKTYTYAPSPIYTVVFNANDGSNTTMKQLFGYGAAARALAKNNFFREGYSFIGWNTKANGSGTFYANEQEVKNLAKANESVTLYAQWVDGDLSKLKGDYVAHNGETLNGSLSGNYKISIPDGATVTLDDVTINGKNDEAYKWAGITCEGSCTIILKGKNTVRGFYKNYPGIYVPRFQTLTIKGTGKLNVSSNGLGAGLGGGYEIGGGNIVIESGEIEATGGSSAAAIGSAYWSSVGNITINGGLVTAKGGAGAAGIGAGVGHSIGNIVISENVDKVTAIAGENAKYSISVFNSGDESSTTNTVTIGGVVYSEGISESPFVYPPAVHIVDKRAIIDGNYEGIGAINITKNTPVDTVIFNRKFSKVGSSSLVLPFEIAVNKVDGVRRVMTFDGVDLSKALVYVNYVWCATDVVDENCPTSNDGKIKAYTPYILEMAGTQSLTFHGKVTIEKVPEKNIDYRLDDWVFRPMLQYKKWEAEDPELTGCGVNKDKSCVYGFAAKNLSNDILTKGKFVRLAAGAYINPLRCYMAYEPSSASGIAPANAPYVKRLDANGVALPDSFSVVVRGKNEETTVIGTFNTKTGEFKFTRNYGTFDLKGRRMNEGKNAHGVYYQKKGSSYFRTTINK